MLEHLIYFSPLGALILGIITLSLIQYNEHETYKCFHLSRMFLYISFVLFLIFYNKEVLPGITSTLEKRLPFFLLLYLGALFAVFLAGGWFSSMGLSGKSYCITVLSSVCIGSLTILSNHLSLTVVGVFILMLEYFSLLLKGRTKNDLSTLNNLYFTIMILLMLLSLAALLKISQISTTLSYIDIKNALVYNIRHPHIYMAMLVILADFMFIGGIAPLHFWFTEGVAKTGLPVFCYPILILSAISLNCIMYINHEVLSSVSEYFDFFYKAIGLTSIAIGAFGTCCSKNVRKVVAYAMVMQMGIVLLPLQEFSCDSSAVSTLYSIIYLTSMYGLCASMFGLKIRGEYLFTLTDFKGISDKKQFMSLVIFWFTLSLIGFPFTPGFIGITAIMQNLISSGFIYMVVYLLFMILVLSYAFWLLLSVMYASGAKILFDKTDSNIYIMLALGILLQIFIALKADNLYIWLTELWQ